MSRTRPVFEELDRRDGGYCYRNLRQLTYAFGFVLLALIATQIFFFKTTVEHLQILGNSARMADRNLGRETKWRNSLQDSLHCTHLDLIELLRKINDFLCREMNINNNLVDYALGGHIIMVYETEPYTNLMSSDCPIIGRPTTKSADVILKPTYYPGECWSVKGYQAKVIIKLSAIINVENVTLEHIHATKSPNGDTSSAPNRFSIWGLRSENDVKNKHLFGYFTYDNQGPSVQTFPVKFPETLPYCFILFQVHSNHGNAEFTCIYRLRIHGKEA